MVNLCALLKEFVSPNGPTTGIGGYDLEGQRKKRKLLARGQGAALLFAKTDSIDWKANEAATSPLNTKDQPTDAQRSAGNYPKGHINFLGLSIAIENPAGSKRREEWPALKSHYGYIKKTEGADGDHVDVFVKPATPTNWTGSVWVIDQLDQNGKFDEHKVMIGWDSEIDARSGYQENYTPDWAGLGAITKMSMEDFKQWLKDGDTTAPVSRTFNTKEK